MPVPGKRLATARNAAVADIVTGLGPRSGPDMLVAASYAGLTVLALAFAYHGSGLRRSPGAAIIAGYLTSVCALAISVR